MLKDITLGQYFPGNTIIHRLDPRAKLLIVFVYIVALFLCKWLISYAIALIFSDRGNHSFPNPLKGAF